MPYPQQQYQQPPPQYPPQAYQQQQPPYPQPPAQYPQQPPMQQYQQPQQPYQPPMGYGYQGNYQPVPQQEPWKWKWSPLIGITYGPVPVGLIIGGIILLAIYSGN